MILCHNGHEMQATHEYDCYQRKNGPTRSFGEVKVYCEEDCARIPAAILAAALAYFTPRYEKTAWEYPGDQVPEVAYAGRGAE